MAQYNVSSDVRQVLARKESGRRIFWTLFENSKPARVGSCFPFFHTTIQHHVYATPPPFLPLFSVTSPITSILYRQRANICKHTDRHSIDNNCRDVDIMDTQMDENGGSDATNRNNNHNISAAPADNVSGTDTAGPCTVGNGSGQGPESGKQPADDATLPDASSGAGGNDNDGDASNAGNGSNNGTRRVGLVLGEATFTSENRPPVPAREPSPSANAESRQVPNSRADAPSMVFGAGLQDLSINSGVANLSLSPSTAKPRTGGASMALPSRPSTSFGDAPVTLNQGFGQPQQQPQVVLSPFVPGQSSKALGKRREREEDAIEEPSHKKPVIFYGTDMVTKTKRSKDGLLSDFYVEGQPGKQINTVGISPDGNRAFAHLKGKYAAYRAGVIIEQHQQTAGMDSDIRIWTSATPSKSDAGSNWLSGDIPWEPVPGQTRNSRRFKRSGQQSRDNAAPALPAAPQPQVITSGTAAGAAQPAAPQHQAITAGTAAAAPRHVAPRYQVITSGTAAAAALPVATEPPVGSCLNCGKNTHTVKDCIGPCNSVQGDIPMCPMCDTMDGKNQDHGHQFDKCYLVVPIVARFQLARGQQMSAAQMQDLTADELQLLFNNLAVGRASKTPLRTRHFCWVDVVLEAARRNGDVAVIQALPRSVPWTKSFAKAQLVKAVPPWDVYDYGNRGMIGSLPREDYPRGAADLRAKRGDGSLPAQVWDMSARREDNGPRQDRQHVHNEYRPQAQQLGGYGGSFGSAALGAQIREPQKWWS